MERELYVFGKEEIARRLQLPMERIDVLIDECGMPTDDEEAYVDWFVENYDRVLEEAKQYGPIAQWEQSSHLPVSEL